MLPNLLEINEENNIITDICTALHTWINEKEMKGLSIPTCAAKSGSFYAVTEHEIIITLV